MFTADKAKARVKKVTDDNLNYQRIAVLEQIKRASTLGKTFVVIDTYARLKFDADDYNFFRKLGYDVQEERVYIVEQSGLPMQKHDFARFSWE